MPNTHLCPACKKTISKGQIIIAISSEARVAGTGSGISYNYFESINEETVLHAQCFKSLGSKLASVCGISIADNGSTTEVIEEESKEPSVATNTDNIDYDEIVQVLGITGESVDKAKIKQFLSGFPELVTTEEIVAKWFEQRPKH